MSESTDTISGQKNTNTAKISCLMVTANRKHLMNRSIHCFNQQNYPNKEMVVVDDGEQDLSEALAAVPDDQLKYVKLEPAEDNTLGKLRNISLQEATGDYLIQWDDDDWYHPDRIAVQAEYLDDGYEACCLSGALMHLDTPEYLYHPYVGTLPEGIPGSIMHRNDPSISYPHTRRAEDTVFLKEWMKRTYIQLPDKYNHLFIRCYHGDNTWEKEHFLRRIRNSPVNLLTYAWHKFVRGNLFNHPKFQLSGEAQEAFEMYMKDSRKFGLIHEE